MTWRRNTLACLFLGVLPALAAVVPAMTAAAPGEKTETYRVLDPIESGDLKLYPIVRANSSGPAAHWRYITLDEGLQSGQVVIEEAGKARGLVRRRSPNGGLADEPSNDEVNTLVLENRSRLPLLLLAGEIVTGGKQDRVIGKDRIVAPNSAPLDLSVFCIEPGRWQEETPVFHGSGRGKHLSFMAEPSIRERAMVEKDQLRVWSAVRNSIAAEQASAAPASTGAAGSGPAIDYNLPATSSYAQTMASPAAARQVDSIARPVLEDESGAVPVLLKEQAVGVVAAIHGHIVWADLFATPELLAAYWPKLVRSYAAEALHSSSDDGPVASKEAALEFVQSAVDGHETSEGISSVYRYREVHGQTESVFQLEALLPGTGFEVHRTKVYQREAHAIAEPVRPQPPLRGDPVYHALPYMPRTEPGIAGPHVTADSIR
ncbi:MAG: DUF6569 family protein [Terracidiphilus sp.]